MEKIKKFLSGSSWLVKNLIKLNKFTWKDTKKVICILYIATVMDIASSFVARWSQAIIINKLTEISKWRILEQKTLLILTIILVVSLVLPSFINTLKGFYIKVIYRKIDELINISFLGKKVSLNIEQLENSSNHLLFQRVQENIWRFKNYFYSQFTMFDYWTNMMIILVTMLFLKPSIAFLIAIFTLPELVIELSSARTIWNIESMGWGLKRKYNYLKNIFSQIPSVVDIKLSWNSNFFIRKLENIITPFLDEQYKADKKRHLFLALATLSSKIWVIISTFILIFAVYYGEMQVGTFVFLYWLIVSFQNSLAWFFRTIVSQYEDNLYIEEFFWVQDLKQNMIFSENPVILDQQITPVIEFRDLTFTYPEKDKEILHKINLTINPWEKIAIVWVNGAGKSTIVKLLTRFYDVTSGEILIGWKNIKDLDLNSWWRIIWYMPQDATNYMFQIKQAIAISDTTQKIDINKVEKSAQMSLASEFIETFKDKYNQQLGRNFDWEGLSWWQWQRMNLARIFYKNPQVYILDEPTSAMDAEAEAKIFETLSNLPKDKTVIFISHRFSTIRQADRICIIEDGKITEIWTHEELINNDKTYKRLFELQAKGYE